MKTAIILYIGFRNYAHLETSIVPNTFSCISDSHMFGSQTCGSIFGFLALGFST